MLLLLLLPAFPQDGEELRRLIGLLSHEEIDVRQDAARRLAAVGRSAIPALKEALGGGDAQRTGAVRDILLEIDRRARIEDLCPPCVRLDLTLKDEAVDAALAKAARSFGLEPPDVAPAFAGRKISLELTRASLWETFDALSRAAGGEWGGLDPTRDPGSENRLVFQEPEDRPFRSSLNLDDVRIFLDTENGRAMGRTVESDLRFVVGLPFGAWVEEARLSEVQVRLDGRALETKAEPSEISCVRTRGLPTRFQAGRIYLPRTFKEKGPLDVRGVLILEVPEAVETLKPTGGDGRMTLTYPLCTVRGAWSPEIRNFSVTLMGETGPERMAIQIAARDAAGGWMCDMALRARPNVVFQVGESQTLKEAPGRVEAWRVTRTRTRSIPFHFPAVPVPDFR